MQTPTLTTSKILQFPAFPRAIVAPGFDKDRNPRLAQALTDHERETEPAKTVSGASSDDSAHRFPQ